MKTFRVTISRVVRDDSDPGWHAEVMSDNPMKDASFHTESGVRQALNDYWRNLPHHLKPSGHPYRGDIWLSGDGLVAYYLRELAS